MAVDTGTWITAGTAVVMTGLAVAAQRRAARARRQEKHTYEAAIRELIARHRDEFREILHEKREDQRVELP